MKEDTSNFPMYRQSTPCNVVVMPTRVLIQVDLIRGRNLEANGRPFVAAQFQGRTAAIHPIQSGSSEFLWRQSVRLMWERGSANSNLELSVWDWLNSHENLIGTVESISLTTIAQKKTHCYYVKPTASGNSGRYGTLEFEWRIIELRPCEREVIVRVDRATQLKNVKPWVKRISFEKPHLRKMSPYCVISVGQSNSEEVSPPILHAGRNPNFNFEKTVRCPEQHLEENRLELKVEIHHRHKAEIKTGSLPVDRLADRLIGVVNITLSNESTSPESSCYDVRTPKGKFGGSLCCSVKTGKLLDESSPSPSWSPREISSTPPSARSTIQPKERSRFRELLTPRCLRFRGYEKLPKENGEGGDQASDEPHRPRRNKVEVASKVTTALCAGANLVVGVLGIVAAS